MFRDMPFLDLLKRFSPQVRQNVHTLPCWIERPIAIQAGKVIAGSCREIENNLVRLFHIEGIGHDLHASSPMRTTNMAGESHVQARLARILLRQIEKLSFDPQLPIIDGISRGILFPGVLQPESQRSRLIRREAKGDHIVLCRSEQLSFITDSVQLIAHRNDTRSQIQRSSIGCRLDIRTLFPYKIDTQLPKRLVGTHTQRLTSHVLFRKCCGLLKLLIEQQLLDARQLFRRFRIRLALGARPKAFLIQLDDLMLAIAIDHGSQPTIADGKCLLPAVSRFHIPQHCVPLLRLRNEYPQTTQKQ